MRGLRGRLLPFWAVVRVRQMLMGVEKERGAVEASY